MESYENIVKRMEDAYREESGQEVEAVSDLGLRLRVLAGELYRLQAGMDWLWRQAFPQTATGEQLDRHGAQRGLARREASHAQGELTFSRYLALDFDLVIPAGTLCAAPGEEAVEYETLEEGVLSAGELTVDIPAQAVLGGSGGNAAAGYISTLVTPVTGIDYVTNEAAFTGGRDPEEDEAYRARVLGAYQRCATTGNAGFYESAPWRSRASPQSRWCPGPAAWGRWRSLPGGRARPLPRRCWRSWRLTSRPSGRSASR